MTFQSHLFFLIVVTIAIGSRGLAEPPYTHRIIIKEISRLGGESESETNVVFVAFRGREFATDHFEMLSHLSELRWFSADDVNAQPDGLKMLASLPKLSRIDIHKSRQLVNGLVQLRGKKSLEEIKLEDIDLSSDVVDAMQEMPSLTSLELESIRIDAKALDSLIKLCTKLELTFGLIEGISSEQLQTLLTERDASRSRKNKTGKQPCR
jgi:hypothetical protein